MLVCEYQKVERQNYRSLVSYVLEIIDHSSLSRETTSEIYLFNLWPSVRTSIHREEVKVLESL